MLVESVLGTPNASDAVSRSLPPTVEVPDRVLGHPVLTGTLRATTFAVAEALFTGDTPPPRDRIDWLVDETEAHLALCGVRARWVFRGSLRAVSAVAPPMSGTRPPFRDLPLATRVHALERMERSPLGLAVFAIKAILCILYFEHPDVAASVRADGTCLHGQTP